MDAIFKRRSVRRYTALAVNDSQVRSILGAGMNAPSAGNEQPWHFILIRDKERLKKLSGSSPYASMVGGASLAVVVCADLELEKHKGFWVQDCSAAVENILVEVSALGLGAVWLGVYPRQDRIEYIKAMFDLPASIMPFAIIPVGYPMEEAKAIDRYRQDRVHLEHW